MTSSHERGSRYNEATDSYSTWNGNADTSGFVARVDDDGDGSNDEFLLAEAKGAGYISHIWSADPREGRVKIYVDGAVAFDMPFGDYFNGVGFSWKELSYGEDDADAAMGHNLYVPITFNESMRVVAYTNWGHFYQVNYTLMPEGKSVEPMPSVLTDAQKEMIGIVVSSYNCCAYCLQSHGDNLRGMWKNASLVDRLSGNFRACKDELSREDYALCEYAWYVTAHPRDIDQEQVDKLRDAGFDDHQILEAAFVAGFFNYTNRWVSTIAPVINPGHYKHNRDFDK
jgi:uncharacterized peroxidase-related enzyme